MKKTVLSLLLASSALMLNACGGGDSNDGSDSSTNSNIDINNIQNPVVGTPTAYNFPKDAPPNAAESVVMTYKMKGIKGKEVLATALVFTPKTVSPSGGWPIVVWAHGTTGVADKCAPSGNELTIPGLFGPGDPIIKNMIDSFVKEGYVVVAPDYEGLGEPSGLEMHPYLNVKSAAYSITDAVVATKSWLRDKASTKWAVVGHSQGGHAALAAAQYAARAKMDYKGAVAVAPASNLELINNLSEMALANLGDYPAGENMTAQVFGYVGLDALTSLMIAGLKSTYTTEIQYNKVFKSPTDKIAETAESKCMTDIIFAFMEPMAEYLQEKNGTLKGYPRKVEGYLNDPIVKKFLSTDSQPLQTVVYTPIIIYQGAKDTVVLPQATDTLVKQTRAMTTVIDYRTDPTWNHGTAYSVNVNNGKLLQDIKTMLNN